MRTEYFRLMVLGGSGGLLAKMIDNVGVKDFEQALKAIMAIVVAIPSRLLSAVLKIGNHGLPLHGIAIGRDGDMSE